MKIKLREMVGNNNHVLSSFPPTLLFSLTGEGVSGRLVFCCLFCNNIDG